MVSLVKFKDNTYAWSKVPSIQADLSKSEAIAFGYWKYKIPKQQIQIGLEIINTGKYDVAIFSEIFGIFLKADKIDYSGFKNV